MDSTTISGNGNIDLDSSSDQGRGENSLFCVWDSESGDDKDDDESTGGQIPIAQNHMLEIKTSSGVYKIDPSAPDVQVQKVEKYINYFYKKRMADECLRESIRRLTLTRIVHGDQNPQKMASCHALISKVYWNLKGYAEQTLDHALEAETLLSLSIGGYELVDELDKLDIELLIAYLKAEESAGNVEAAIEHYVKAYSVAEANWNGNNVQVGDAAFALANAYCRTKHDDAYIYAESYFNTAVQCYTSTLGTTNPKTLKSQQFLAEEMANTGRPLEAISLLTDSLRNLTISGEEYDIKSASIHKQLGTLYAQLGRDQPPRKHLQQCLHIESLYYGASSKTVKATKDSLKALTKRQEPRSRLHRGETD